MLIRNYVWFDDWIKTRSGKRKPYYSSVTFERNVKDQELIWFHEGYGRMQLYRVHKVDNNNFIAEDLHKGCYTSSDRWDELSEKPELALV